MSEISIKLADGSERKIKAGANALDLAAEISHGLKKKVVLAKINGETADVQDPLNHGDTVVLLDDKSPEAKDVIAHSCEHILAAAVVELFPSVQVTMGPKDHSEGFYYDFDIGRPFLEEELLEIEKKMARLMKDGISFKKKWLKKDEAKEIFKKLGQRYKPEILDWIPGDEVTLYESGSFVDLCRGPHLPSTKFIKAFKLLGVSGSYWRGDSSREMLQRIYGVAFGSKEELDTYLLRIEEAKKRDHRKLGPRHDLFFVSEKFASKANNEQQSSEARVLINCAPNVIKNDLVQKVESLLNEMGAILPSKSLLTRGMSIIPRPDLVDNAVEVDLRILAKSDDEPARKDILNLVTKFNDAHDSITIKSHFDVSALEEVGPGLPMWLPHGGRLRSLIEDFSRKRHFAGGYEMVYSPHIAKSDLWRISGHLGFYHDSMFAPMNVDGNEYLLKPMNCPFHVLMYKHKPRSYRDLPIRLAEFGTVYRYELAGALHGLMRVRGFTQDDAHIFCRWDQLDTELDSVMKFVLSMLNAFGFNDFEVNISTRPEKFVGAPNEWEKAEKSLISAVERSGLQYNIDEGGGAFYGPKIDIKLLDCLGRSWQCSTLQLDFNNPERFSLEYVNNLGEKERPLMLHRALFGSIERFIGILIEHYSCAFPAWLAPEQVRVLTVSDRHNDHGEKVAQIVKNAGFRATMFDSREKLGAKIRQAQVDKLPIMLIVGDKEVAENGATLRLRSGEDMGFFSEKDLLAQIAKLCAVPEG